MEDGEQMKKCIVPVTALLVLGVTGGADARILYCLVSPNEEGVGKFAYTVSDAGDVNGDGFGDVVVGAPWEDPFSSPVDAGRAYVFSGATGSLLHELVSPQEESYGFFGISVSDAGDVNHDGYDDIIVGSYEDPGASHEQAGRAYVFSGINGLLLHTLVSPADEYEGWFGCSVAGAGDVNGDGHNDILVGAYGESPGMCPERAGRAYLFSGVSGALLRSLVSPHQQYEGWFGCSVSDAGDVNGDGYSDLLVGAAEDRGPGLADAGQVHVYDGASGAVLSTLISPNEEAYGYFGWSVACAGDANGDGRDDVLVGAWGESPGSSPPCAGRAYVFCGRSGLLIRSLASPHEQDWGQFGWSVSCAGDINHDGTQDFLIGALRESLGAGSSTTGCAYVFCGNSGAPLWAMISPHEQPQGQFGWCLSGAGDMNGDGFDDVIVGAHEESPGASPDRAGRAYVFTPVPEKIMLTGAASEDELILQWSPCPAAASYWIFGAANQVHFLPGSDPGYEFRQAMLSPEITEWASSWGIADPDTHWTYLVLAIDGSDQEILRSNRVGEYDFAIP